MPHKKHDDKASMTKPKNLKRQTDGELEEIKKDPHEKENFMDAGGNPQKKAAWKAWLEKKLDEDYGFTGEDDETQYRKRRKKKMLAIDMKIKRILDDAFLVAARQQIPEYDYKEEERKKKEKEREKN